MAAPAPISTQAPTNPLLAAYRPGDFYYSSARGVLLAEGVHSRISSIDGAYAPAAAAALAAAARAGVQDPLVIGALGFEADAPASLVVPARVRTGSRSPRVPLHGTGGGHAPGTVQALLERQGWTITPQPPPEAYAAAVGEALGVIDTGQLEKVVLARSLDLTAPHPIDVAALLIRLTELNPTAHTFAVDISTPSDAEPRTLLGASPELLVARCGDVVTATPLAGSLPRVDDPAENERRIAVLLASDKDRREHAIVASHVAAVLASHCVDLEVPQPRIVGTASMWHLATPIRGRLTDPTITSLGLAEALHPTPAVCGVPLAAARSAIAQLEPTRRGSYAGLVGWCNQAGDGEWAVTIRSAEVQGNTLRAAAGAGIVAGSQPATELAETTAKLATLLGSVPALLTAPQTSPPAGLGDAALLSPPGTCWVNTAREAV